MVMMSSCGYQLAMGRVCVKKLYLQALASYPGLQNGGTAWVRGSLDPRPFLMVSCERGGGRERKGSGDTA